MPAVRLNVCVCSFGIAAIFLLPGCPSAYVVAPKKLDSWAHFAGGGAFLGGRVSLSPDGMTLAYASSRTGHGDIYMVNIDGSNSTRLTTDEGFEGWPIFSPDGSQIAFVRECDGVRRVWIMEADGTNQKQVTDGFWDDTIGFSANGADVVFLRSDASAIGGAIAQTLAVNVKSGAISPVSTRTIAAISPDGSKLLYTKRGARENEIWLIDRTSSTELRIGAGWEPSFSPDGTRIVHIGPRLQPKEVWTTTVDGKNSKLISTPSRYVIEGPRVCPNGVDVIFLATDDPRGGCEIFRVNTETGIATVVASTE